MKTNIKRAIVSGDTSGMGKEIVKILLSKGCFVVGLSRRENSDIQHESYKHISLDVTDSAKVKEIIDGICKDGDVDLLISCAGFGISGAIEFTDIEDAKKQLDVNFFGMVNMNQAIAPYFREKKKGKIINVSSVAAIAPIPFQSFYSASKAAINSFSCALANELRPFNVKVVAIQPGDIKTGFTAARKKDSQGDDLYDKRISKAVSKMEHDEENGMLAEKAAKKIVKIAYKKNPKPVVTIGLSYKFLSLLIKIFPMRFVNWILYKTY